MKISTRSKYEESDSDDLPDLKKNPVKAKKRKTEQDSDDDDEIVELVDDPKKHGSPTASCIKKPSRSRKPVNYNFDRILGKDEEISNSKKSEKPIAAPPTDSESETSTKKDKSFSVTGIAKEETKTKKKRNVAIKSTQPAKVVRTLPIRQSFPH